MRWVSLLPWRCAGVFSLFLTEYDFIFYVDAGGEPAPRQIEEDILVPDPSDMGLDDATSEESAMTAKTSTDGLGLAQTGGLAAPNGRNGARHANRISWIAGGSIGMGSSGQVLQLRSKRNSLQYAESEADKLLGLGGRRLSNHIIELDPDGAMAEEGDFGGDFVSEGRASVDDDRAASSSTDHSARVYVDASAMESSDPAIVPDSSSARSSGQKQLASANASANPNTNSNANLRSLGVTVPNGHLQTHPPLSPAGSTRSSRSARRSIIPPASSISNMNSTSSGSSSSSAAQAKVQQPIPSGTAHPRSPPPHMA